MQKFWMVGALPAAVADAEHRRRLRSQVGAHLVQRLEQGWEVRVVVRLGLGHVGGALQGEQFAGVLDPKGGYGLLGRIHGG